MKKLEIGNVFGEFEITKISKSVRVITTKNPKGEINKFRFYEASGLYISKKNTVLFS